MARKLKSPQTVTTLNPLQIAGDHERAAEHIILPAAEPGNVITRPEEHSQFWVEREYDEYGEEQRPLWEAAGSVATRPSETTEARLSLAAREVEFLLEHGRVLLDEARELLLATIRILTPYRRRAVGAKIWYQLGKAGLLFGDLVGFSAAAIWLGELIIIALLLAISAAVATIAAGLIGTEISDYRSRLLRQKPSEDLPEVDARFSHLFLGEDAGFPVTKIVTYVSLATAAMIAFGIGTLRGVVDEPIVGVVFGGIALAIAGGSFLVSYAGADEIADRIDYAHADYERTQKKHLRLSSHTAWRSHAEAATQARSVAAEHQQRGQAAHTHMQALKWGILRRNPAHAGHGSAPERVGRTPQRKGTSK